MRNADDLGKLILRLSLGVMILLHGLAKILSGPGSIGGMLAKAGLPAELSYLVYIGEVLAPLLLIIGIWSRLAALVIAVNMVVAVYLVHAQQIFTRGQSGGWALELQGMFLFAAIALLLLGAGSYSMGGKSGKWN